MADSLFSPSWYRVAGLKPRLRSHAQIHRHQYRGQLWYVLQDLSSERFHRFSPSAYMIIGLMDGQRTVQEIWDTALAQLGDDAVSQDEVIQLLGQLHSADVLQCDVPPDTAELFRRRQRQVRSQIQRKVMSLFAWQIPHVRPRARAQSPDALCAAGVQLGRPGAVGSGRGNRPGARMDPLAGAVAERARPAAAARTTCCSCGCCSRSSSSCTSSAMRSR